MTNLENTNLAVEIDGVLIDLNQDYSTECCTISPEEYDRYDFPFQIQGINTPSSTD